MSVVGQYNRDDLKNKNRFEVMAMLDRYISHHPYRDPRRVSNDVSCLLYDLSNAFVVKFRYPAKEPQYACSIDLEGLLPIVFKGNTYRTPVCISLSNHYPHSPPKITVIPSQSMIINKYCPFVAPDGTVKHEYIDRWTPQSSLSELMTLLASAFGAYPPLATVKSQSVTDTVTHTVTQAVSSAANFASSTLSKVSSSLSGGNKPTNPPPSSTYHTPSTTTTTTPSGTPFIDPWATGDQLTPAQERQCLVDMVHVKMEAAWKTAQTELRDTVMEMEQERNKAREAVAAASAAAEAKKKGNTEAKNTYDMVLQESTNLHGWISAFETREPTVFCANTRQEQILNAIAEDRAIDNAIDAVRELLKQRKVSVDTYMQYVRQLSMRQFNARALAMLAAGEH